MRTTMMGLAGVAALLITLTAALAQDAPQRVYVEPTEAEISLDNTFFFRIRTPAAGYKVSARERIINQRLVEILSCRRAGPVTIGAIRGKPTIYVDGYKLVTVYPRDVAANRATCMVGLARTWAANLRCGLSRVMPGYRGEKAPEAAPAPVGASPD